MTPDRARDIITRRLQPGERIIWHDAPNPWLAARPLLFTLVFSFIWTNLAISEATALLHGQPSAEDQLSAQALKIQVVMIIIGIALFAYSLRRIVGGWNTAYGLTNKRAVIAVGNRGSTQSFTADAFQSIRTEGESRGSLKFNYTSDSEGAQGYANGFYGIRNPARVEALIRKTLQPSASTATHSGLL